MKSSEALCNQISDLTIEPPQRNFPDQYCIQLYSPLNFASTVDNGNIIGEKIWIQAIGFLLVAVSGFSCIHIRNGEIEVDFRSILVLPQIVLLLLLFRQRTSESTRNITNIYGNNNTIQQAIAVNSVLVQATIRIPPLGQGILNFP